MVYEVSKQLMLILVGHFVLSPRESRKGTRELVDERKDSNRGKGGEKQK